jgi:hypothetical protein
VTSRGSLTLVYLSDQFTAATNVTDQFLYAAAAEALIAQNNTPSLVGILSAAGILLISLVIIRGGLPRWVGWLGIIAGVIGILSEALRFVTPVLYLAYGVLLGAWFIAVGIALIRFAGADHKLRVGSQRLEH